METIKIKKNMVKSIVTIMGGVILSLASAMLTFYGLSTNRFSVVMYYTPLGYILTAIMTVITVVAIKVYLFNKFAIIIEEDGFYDYSSWIATKDVLVKWEDVSSIKMTCLGASTFLSVKLKNPDKYFQRLSSFKRFLIGMNKKMGYPGILINLVVFTNKRQQEIFTIMEYYFEKHKERKESPS